MKLYKLSWILWIIGTILVVGSWIGVVPVGIAWFGWFAALAGTVMGLCCRPRVACRVPVYQQQPRSAAEEIAKLDLLRQEGIISDEEFRREKANLLARN